MQDHGAVTPALAAPAKPVAAASRPSAAAAERWEGYWAKNRRECRPGDDPDSKTMIDLKDSENGKPAPLYDQYENHCRIDSHATRGNTTTLKLTCFEFWELPGQKTRAATPSRYVPGSKQDSHRPRFLYSLQEIAAPA